MNHPKKETVYRTTKAVLKNDVLKIISSEKTKTALPGYHDDIIFAKEYKAKICHWPKDKPAGKMQEE